MIAGTSSWFTACSHLYYRFLSADGDGERFPTLAAECLRLKADIIAVSTTPATQAAKKITHTIPIVMIALGDPVGTGLTTTPGFKFSVRTGLAARACARAQRALPDGSSHGTRTKDEEPSSSRCSGECCFPAWSMLITVILRSFTPRPEEKASIATGPC